MKLQMGPDTVPSTVRVYEKVEFKRVPTNGDGGCAIHSVFGNPSENGLFLHNARGFLRKTFAPTSAALRMRVHNNDLVDELAYFLWKDIVLPQAKRDAGISVCHRQLDFEEIQIWAAIK